MALGFCDLIIESLTQRWDGAALMPVIEAAGCILTDWRGSTPGNGGVLVAAGDKRVHEAALKLLND